jgi:hypothetical protein
LIKRIATFILSKVFFWLKSREKERPLWLVGTIISLLISFQPSSATSHDELLCEPTLQANADQ